MITEDYVSFETAKLLKEKGFDEKCRMCWDEVTKTMEIADEYEYATNSELLATYISAPTLQMATKWLRKEHNLHCNSDYDIVFGWYCQITSLTETVEEHYKEMKQYRPDKYSGFSSPEEACEAAIKYCLEKLV